MARLINLSTLGIWERNPNAFNDPERAYGWNDLLEILETAPTVDAVEVIRCRDCKHCDPENYHCDHPMGTAAPLSRKPDDFCSYGERKEGAY